VISLAEQVELNGLRAELAVANLPHRRRRH
jgi:hypothetical protein